MSSAFSGIMRRVSRRRPVKALVRESGREMTFDELTLEDKVIHDNLKNRGFIVTEASSYINFPRDVKAGRYEVFECSAEGGATTTTLTDISEGITTTINLHGPLTVKVSEVLHYIITSAEDVYNIEDTNLLMKLLKVKADVWQLLIVGGVMLVMGIFAGRAF